MSQEPPREGRRPHPLEQRPPGPPPTPSGGEQPPQQRIALRLRPTRPTVTYVLIAINVLVFVIRAISPDLDSQILTWGANVPDSVLRGGEYYRLVTAMFLHASIYGPRDSFVLSNAMHILLNMYILYSVGPQLEAWFGHTRFTIIYLLGGLMGSVFSALLAGNSASVGASGAVFASIAGEFIFLYRNRRLFGARGQAQMRSLITFALINFAFGALTSVAGTLVRIDNWGHLGGMVGGLALAWFISPVFAPRLDPENPAELVAQDTNPLAQKYWVLFAYVVVLIALLAFGSLNARR